jgi:hypothetical protein
VGPLDDLAAAVTQLRYGAGDAEDGTHATTTAATAVDAAATIERTCRDIVGRRRVVTDRFDPRFIRPNV